MSIANPSTHRPPLNWERRSYDSLQRSCLYLYLIVSLWRSVFSLMYSQYCLLMTSERWQWSSGNHNCLWSMTTKKKVWRWSLPLIDDDSNDDLNMISMCHRPWHEGWSVERIWLWAIASQRKVWGSPLLLIIDGDDVVFVDSCRDENISKPFWWTLLACSIRRMRAVEK